MLHDHVNYTNPNPSMYESTHLFICVCSVCMCECVSVPTAQQGEALGLKAQREAFGEWLIAA